MMPLYRPATVTSRPRGGHCAGCTLGLPVPWLHTAREQSRLDLKHWRPSRPRAQGVVGDLHHQAAGLPASGRAWWASRPRGWCCSQILPTCRGHFGGLGEAGLFEASGGGQVPFQYCTSLTPGPQSLPWPVLAGSRLALCRPPTASPAKPSPLVLLEPLSRYFCSLS